MIQLSLSTGEPIQLKPAPARKSRGNLLPGSELFKTERDDYVISIHQFVQPLYSLYYYGMHFKKELKLTVHEQTKGLRLETALTGSFAIREVSGKEILLLPGQYHITDVSVFQTQYLKDHGCTFFSIYYTPELLAGMGLSKPLSVNAPRPMPVAMKELIFELLENPFDQYLRPFYYENCVREMLFLHLSAPLFTLPGELNATEIAAIHEADRIIAEDLNAHLTIKQIAKRSGTNAFILKKGFQQIFGVGVFQRLLQRRMDRAKFLLENTDKPIKDVCELAGYDTLAGFITAFRKRFQVTPKDWRKQKRGGY